jgi:BON domain
MMSFVTCKPAGRAMTVARRLCPWHDLRCVQAMPAIARLAFALCLAFAAAPARPDPGDAIERVKPAEAAGDAWINARVAAALLMDDDLTISDMQVTTRDGRVRLSGVVRGDEGARAAERIAWRVDGVRAVVNSLSVRSALPAQGR